MPNVDASQEGRRRLAECMEERRKQLRLRWSDVAATAGIAIETLNAVRRVNDSGIRDLTLRAIDDGLRWQPGSAERILGGGDPVPINSPPPPSPPRPPRPEHNGVSATRVIADWLDTYERLQTENPAAAQQMIDDARENIRRIREENERRGRNSA